MSKKMMELLMDCRIVSAFSSGCQAISMKRWRLITECWTEWGTIWILQGVFCLGPWTNSRWYLRPNQAGGWEPSSHHSSPFFCWFTT
ncbi:hypothetical protein Zm00014a_008941 [Zea mays]|uniref:Uncharacterized protein n=1 Tax=Zea mays TaxID=4577 RepID=A0A3L6ENX6_MAIZE|nr:hypothetical protein Zm00014a_008941 [Zea mays]